MQPLFSSIQDLKSNWMNALYPLIKNFKLKELFLPGTHGSGAWKMENKITSHWTKT